jgi:hypothetical protein
MLRGDERCIKISAGVTRGVTAGDQEFSYDVPPNVSAV